MVFKAVQFIYKIENGQCTYDIQRSTGLFAVTPMELFRNQGVRFHRQS